MNKNFVKCSALFIILIVININISSAVSPAQNQKTFLWKVQSKTATAYLLGSIHFMKKDAYPLNQKIENAFDSSDVLAVEANINDISKIDFHKLVETAIYPGYETLDKHISGETYERIRKQFESLGIPPLIISKQKPWFLALTLTSLKLIELGYDPSYGIDIHFLSKAEGNKQIKELESIDFQINLLSGFSDKEQETFLLYTLNDLHTLEKDAEKLISAWKNGDTKKMESIMNKPLKENGKMSSIYEKLVDDRNRNMVLKIEDFLKTNESHFVIIGAGHLVGKKGIVKLLKDKGYSVEQL